MKIRIFALAKELGLDSKELIEYCNEAGVPAKNSALASISPEQRDVVVNHIRHQQSASSSSSSSSASYTPPATPVREEVSGAGKIRNIEVSARAQGGRSRPNRSDEGVGTATVERETSERKPDELETETVDEEAIEAEIPTEEVEAETEPEVEETVEPEVEVPPAEIAAEDTAAQTAIEEEAEEVEEEAATETTPAAIAEPEAEPTTPNDADKDAEAEKPESHRPEDYIGPSGTSARPIREMDMKPRGNISEPSSRRPKGGKKPARPNFPFVAAAPPEVNTPAPKRPDKTEGPAQKPVMRLSGDMLKGEGPLRDQLKRHIEEKERVDKGGGPKSGGKKPVDLQRRRDREQEEPARSKVRRKGRGRGSDEEFTRTGPSVGRRGRKKKRGPITFKTAAEVDLPITIRSLSEAMGRPARDLIGVLFRQGTMVKINDLISEDMAMELALEFGVDLTVKHGRDIEGELAAMLEADDDTDALVERPPVVTILGHVDHGKTSLLDKIRSANVAAGEAGGITQHIASYQVRHNDKAITFVDTPGHAAFGEMRARGANVTDIIVLVVAADDGVMPQTVECISHAKAAGVPMIVAMNKIDLPDVNEQKVLQDLAQQDVLPTEWGGEVDVIRTSAATGQGIDNLLETILVTAELHELKASPDRSAIGVCLEAFRDEGRGVIAWLIIQKGTLSIGDVVLCGQAYGKVRAMYDDMGREIEHAGPSTPVKITGLDIVPGAGDRFFQMADLDEARITAEDRRHYGRTEVLAATSGKPKTLEELLSGEAAVKDLPLILKADTPGSLEALKGEINKFEHPEVRTELIHEGVGGVNESDVSLAAAAGAIIIAFHVVPEDRAALEADRQGVEIRRYDIIYEVTDHIRQALEGLLEPERVQETTGRAIVLQTFKISRFGSIAGCRILNGTIDRNSRVHVVRDQKILGDYNIASLKREKDDTKEVREGMECGIRLDGFNDVKEGDLFEAFKIREVKRTL